jgi:hypothetical protein
VARSRAEGALGVAKPLQHLCALLGLLDPVTADPQGDWFTFEKGASKTSGGDGWADLFSLDFLLVSSSYVLQPAWQ